MMKVSGIKYSGGKYTGGSVSGGSSLFLSSRRRRERIIITLLFLLCFVVLGQSQELFRMQSNIHSRVISFENQSGKAGQAGKENRGAKGHPSDVIKAGEQRVLMNYTGPAIIQRIWCTVNEREPIVLRSIRLQIYWEGSNQPAVDVPLSDFFGTGLGKKLKFQSALFSDPEGRSFNCIIPMPFKKMARVVLMNESATDIDLFYDIDLVEVDKQPDDMLYFHAYWSRQNNSPLGKDFELLPKITGKGRFLGVNVGVITDPIYGDTWWGEGEVKIYMDGDKDFPTINGTGVEDYIGTAWGMGTFAHEYQGCLVADEKKGEFLFYRYHIPDAIYFHKDIRVTIQQLGGGNIKIVRELITKGVPLKPVTISTRRKFYKLLEMEQAPAVTDESLPNGWVNFYRVDDYSATSYFYLDKPVNSLPALTSVAERTKGLK